MESFNGKLRDELLNRELFLSLAEARYVLDEWRLDYNHRRPHSALDWQTPAAFAANLKVQEGRADGAFPSAMQADHPGFSHKDWTKKPEGPPCHAHIFTSFHDNISIRTIPRPQPHRSSPGFAEGQQRPPFRQHQSWNTQNRHITLALVKDDGFRQLTLLSLSGALAGTFAMSSTNTWIRAPFTLLSSTLRLRHSSFLGYLGISSFVIPAVSRLVVKYAGSLG